MLIANLWLKEVSPAKASFQMSFLFYQMSLAFSLKNILQLWVFLPIKIGSLNAFFSVSNQIFFPLSKLPQKSLCNVSLFNNLTLAKTLFRSTFFFIFLSLANGATCLPKDTQRSVSQSHLQQEAHVWSRPASYLVCIQWDFLVVQFLSNNMLRISMNGQLILPRPW